MNGRGVRGITGIRIWNTLLQPVVEMFLWNSSRINPYLALVVLCEIDAPSVLIQHWLVEHLVKTTLTALATFTFSYPRHIITAP